MPKCEMDKLLKNKNPKADSTILSM